MDEEKSIKLGSLFERLIDELIENDIEPMLTLYHWDLPQALQDEYNGWESRQIIEDFTHYAETLFEAFRGKSITGLV